jgi:hypothetical protein
MKLTLPLFFTLFALTAQDLLIPRTDLLELRIELKNEDKNILRIWAQNEFKKQYTKDGNTFSSYKIFALFRLIENEDSFAETFIKIVAGVKTVSDKKADDTAAHNIINRLAQSKDINKQRLAWYFYDYLTNRFSKDKAILKIRDSLPDGNWTHILPNYSYQFNVADQINNKKPVKIGTKIKAAKGYEKKARLLQDKAAFVNGLIVITLRNGRTTGMASQISALAIDSKERNGRAFIDQEVGTSMKRSLANAMIALQKRYPLLAPNKSIMISFGEREAMKDGNSAGVAFALLLYSLYEDIDIDPSIAVTGVILPDCGVKAVGGVPSKIRGAWRKGLKLAVIPEENKDSVKDLTLIYELPILWNIQIFTAKHLTEVLPVATEQKSPKIKEAIKRFWELSKILNKGNKEIVANKKHIVSELEEILKLAPNHESSRVLKAMLTGRRPKSLTLNGSVDFLFMMIERTLSISPGKAYETAEELLTHNRRFLTSGISKISPHAKPFAGEILKYLDSLIKFRRLLVFNIHKDKKNIGTALNLLESESETMDLTRERLQRAWNKLQKKL